MCLIRCEPAPNQPDSSTVGPRLIQLLKDPSPDIRRTVALSLGKIGDTNGIPALQQSLRGDVDAQVREYSAWALGQIGDQLSEDAIIGLLTALGDADSAVKQAAASAFGHIGPQERAMHLLNEIFSISGADTRLAVIQTLREMDTPSAYPLYLTALQDPQPRIRQMAVSGLGELGDRRALPLIRNRLFKDEDEGVRSEAAFRLGKLGDHTDILALKKAIREDPSQSVQMWSNWALQEIEQSGPAL